MNTVIKAIFFDLGNTLRILHKVPDYQQAAKEEFARLAGTDLSPDEFLQMIEDRYAGYRKWCFRTQREATEVELFTKWLLPDYDRERVEKNAVAMAFQYRQCAGKRLLVPNGKRSLIPFTSGDIVWGLSPI